MSASEPDYFALFGLARRFALDPQRLALVHREVLGRVHPDRFAGAGPAERRAAMQLSSQANDAYRILRSDTERGAYLCRSHGVVVDGPGAAALGVDFLEQQMERREALEAARSARDLAALKALAHTLATERVELVRRIGASIDDAGDYAAAAAAVRMLLFLDKLATEIERIGAEQDAPLAAGG